MAGSKTYRSEVRRIVIPGISICFLVIGNLWAQVGASNHPVYFTAQSASEIPTESMPPIDRPALLDEDELDRTEGLPFRFGIAFEADYSLENSGVWTRLPDGSRLWQLRIECPGAYSINLIFDLFHLPPGATFFVLSVDGRTIRGAFTDDNNKHHGKFSTAPVPGESCVLEYREPVDAFFKGRLGIAKVIHGYRDIFSLAKNALDFGESGACNINVNCPEGSDWQNEKRAVAMIITDDGRRVCTGTLVNNARQDLTPYLLTADHCPGPYETWLFMFGYESPSCDDVEGPLTMTTSGATPIANDAYSDFRLVRLDETPPKSYNVYYAGWTTSDSPADSTVTIHHPSGDIKKISFDNDPVVAAQYLGGPGVDESHWRVAAWDAGTTEEGSSGCPLFDYSHRIIGQLHGGAAACGVDAPDWFGKFSYSWSLGSAPHERLRDWLDPDSTGIAYINGRDNTGLTVYHHPSPDTPTVADDYEVVAHIVSDCDILPESLLARFQTMTGTYTVPLSSTGYGNTFSGWIPAQPPGSQTSYYVSAEDVCGRHASSAWYSFHTAGICADINPGIAVGYGESETTLEYTLSVHNMCELDANLSISVSGNSWATTLWDISGNNPLPASIFVAQEDTARLLVRVEVPAGPDGDADSVKVVVSVEEDPSIETFSILKTVIGTPEIVCGDVTGDLKITMSDILYMVDHVYISKQPLPVAEAANVNGSSDGLITLSDITLLISHLYIAGEELHCP